MRHGILQLVSATLPEDDPCPSDEAWCSYCSAPIGLGIEWRERQPSFMVTRPHAQYCTAYGAERDALDR